MKRAFAVICFSILIGVVSANAQPVEWSIASGGNGHWYEIVRDTSSPWVTWTEAEALAKSGTHMGMQGHLATITSSEEKAFLWNPPFLGSSMGIVGDLIWLGGYQTPTGYPEDGPGNMPDDNWRWVTGEAWGYTHWDSAPDNGGSSDPDQAENYLSMSASIMGTGGWDDAMNNAAPPPGSPAMAYIVEYEPSSAVPAPAAVWLLGAGLAGLAGWRKRAVS